MSQITTHVLDTSSGQPAKGITIRLQRPAGADLWEDIVSGVTNDDGRVQGLVPADMVLKPGIYRMYFQTGEYFAARNTRGFYPYIPVVFEIHDTEHYHVPLLLNPFGYSTYRGS
ncbi:MAG: hydroxyisourate hydrolase [Crocinitomicaceae bacterium]|nr:hydroxyisourate hydrolase [Crocinitomicaceae bacterium]